MRRIAATVVFLLVATSVRGLTVSFFCKELQFSTLNIVPDISISDSSNWTLDIADMNLKPLESVVIELTNYKSEFKLNDWFTYILTKIYIQTALVNNSRDTQAVYLWYCLSKLGYNSIINDNIELEVFVYSNDSVPYIFSYKNYYKLFGSDIKAKSKVNFIASFDGLRTFSFNIKSLPDLACKDILTKNFWINLPDRRFQFTVPINLYANEYMLNYPKLDIREYFNVPLSDDLYYALIPEMMKYTGKMNDFEALLFLLVFTRQNYHLDTEVGYNSNDDFLIAEEVLVLSICGKDDRAILFFTLVKEVLNLPMIVLRHQDGIEVGVLLDTSYSYDTAYSYKGMTFAVCEPADRDNLFKLRKPIELKNVEVLLYYDGDRLTKIY